MTSKQIICDEENQATSLPPMIILNPRSKIAAHKIHVTSLLEPHKHEEVDMKTQQLVRYRVKRPPPPLPLSPLHITWTPNILCVTLETEPVVSKIWIWNMSSRPIYIHACGLWEETARFGASWLCYPRTRFWLPTGLKAEIRIRAKPRDLAPVPSTTAYLQIAAEHMRDKVTGYFAIPIHVTFLNYIQPPESEG